MTVLVIAILIPAIPVLTRSLCAGTKISATAVIAALRLRHVALELVATNTSVKTAKMGAQVKMAY